MPTTRSSTRSSATPAPPAVPSLAPARWSHKPTGLTLLWLAVSLPLVTWDTLYVLLRPHSMEGGAVHWPVWSPYKLYGEIDHVYGWKAYNAGNGFTGAQSAMNVVETAMYVAYFLMWRANRDGQGRISGAKGGKALVLLWSAAVMTLSKTVLYWLNEYFSGFDNIGQNDAITLFFLWIIPNGAWLVFPTYMIWATTSDFLRAFALASHEKAE